MKKWTHEEELNFLKGLSKGDSLESLSKVHDRTVSALDLRLKKIIYDNMVGGAKETSLAKLLNMDSEKIRQYYYEYKGFVEKKNKSATNIEPTAPNPFIPPKVDTIMLPANTTSGGMLPNTTLGELRGDKNLEQHGGIQAHKFKSKIDVDAKIKKLEKENNFMKQLLENIKLKNQINKVVKEGILDSKVKRMLKLQ